MKTNFEISKWKPDPARPQSNFVVFDSNCSVKDLISGLKEYLSNIDYGNSGESVLCLMDYILPCQNLLFADTEIPRFHFIYCYIVEGSSEGYYFHISAAVKTDIPDHPDPDYNGLSEKRLITAKTLMGLQEALCINYYINSFLLQAS